MLDVSKVIGMDDDTYGVLVRLVKEFNDHIDSNRLKRRYYEGKITLGEVNLGLALPDGLKGLEMECGWGTNAVDILAGRSMFDGFVGKNGEDVADIERITDRNNLVSEYSKACSDELIYACSFATLTRGDDGAVIRFHSPETASALWDGEKGRVKAGLAIIDTEERNGDEVVKVLNLYTDTAIWVLTRNDDVYQAVRYPHRMGRPLFEPMMWRPTSKKPFGRSRLKSTVRRLMQGYVRTICNATIGLEFATSPQKYLLGVTDEQYDVLINQKFKQYVGSILASTQNPETGANPTFGQLPQGNIEPHVQMMRILATQFCAITGLSFADVGVINDANPSSADALLAQTQTLVSLAEKLNSRNGDSLKVIMRMALAIERNVSLDELSSEDTDFIAHFKNPAMPSVSVTADAAIKIASARQGFSDTDVFLEMIGFSQAEIRRIKAQEGRVRGVQLINEIANGTNNQGTMG